MKKLLIGTALGSAMLLTGVAQAETKLSGYYEVNYRAVGSSGSGNTNSPNATIGTEMDINLESTNQLSNGMTLGIFIGTTNEITDTSPATKAWGTDSYGLTISSGDTSFQLAVDRGDTADIVSDLVPNPVDQPLDNIVSSGRLSSTGAPQGTTDVQAYAHVTVAQKVGSGLLTATYLPSTGNTENLKSGVYNTASDKSGYSVAYKGRVMEGLEIGFGYEKLTGYEYQDAKSITYGGSYTSGPISVGAQKSSNDVGTAGSGETAKTDRDMTHYGITYKVSDAFSIGAATQKIKASEKTQDEKYNQLEAAYSLGALGVGISYTTVDNIGGTSGVDDKQLMIRLTSKL